MLTFVKPKCSTLQSYDRILVPIQPSGTRNPLFLIPGVYVLADSRLADAQFFQYVQFVRSLGESQPVYGLRTIGLGNTLKSFRSVEHMALEYANAVQRLQPEGPYLLTGDCLGGILAYAIAHQLLLRQSRVALVMLNTYFPHRLYRKFLAAEVKREKREQNITYGGVDQLWKKWLTKERQVLTSPKFLIDKIRSLMRYRTSGEYRALKHFTSEKAHLSELIKNYDPPHFGGRLSLLVEEAVCKAGWAGYGWDKLADNGAEIHPIPGDHTACLGESVGIVTKIIREIADSNEAERGCTRA
jgi:thioesterase domain-containing protein